MHAKVLGLALTLVGCQAPIGAMPQGEVPGDGIAMATCGGEPFPVAVLDGIGPAPGNDPAAEALRAHLDMAHVETDWLPDDGWIEATRTDEAVLYLAPAVDGSFAMVTIGLDAGRWSVDGWGGCQPRPAVDPAVGIAEFRVAPGEGLGPESSEFDVLVSELACNSGEDARGRILPPQLISDADSVTVVMTVRPRGGGQDCPSNPETPFLLQLPEPLGERTLLDGSTIPPRDATLCPAWMGCP